MGDILGRNITEGDSNWKHQEVSQVKILRRAVSVGYLSGQDVLQGGQLH